MGRDERNEKSQRICTATHANMLRAVANITPLGLNAETGEALTPAQLAKAVKLISGKTATQIRAMFDGREPTAREMIEAAVGVRWGCLGPSIRAFTSGRRCPTWPRFKAFFDDCRMYGKARFDADGVIKESLGQGLDRYAFLDSVPTHGSRTNA